jgi:hypothetical protein
LPNLLCVQGQRCLRALQASGVQVSLRSMRISTDKRML